MVGPDGAEIIICHDATEWENWLAENHGGSTGVWLKIAKKRSGRTTVTIIEALDVALCYGWIDSVRQSHDDGYYLQRYSPRRPNSHWSRVNVDKVEALIAAGRMQAPGLAQVNAAKADGRWAAAYESQRNATVPADLAAALQRNEPAKRFFDQLGKTDRYQIILRLLKAKTPEGRAALLEKTILTLAAGERA
ncbi:MAG TPA: YdeI/OmpD-associated family protein [Jiangellaceae bacterium]|nr:YdeI/OmpD-associated family protein [Jiangellaceae bacterium]